jgi:hypothetical protein
MIAAADHLKNDGYFLLTTPNNIEAVAARVRFLATGTLPEFDRETEPTHVFPVLIDTFDRLATRAGLVVVDRWSYSTHGSVIFSSRIRGASSILRRLLSERAHGDIHCILCRRQDALS